MVLKTSGDLGEVTISNNVISEIAGAVATKCYGVVGMASRNKKDGIVNLLKADSMTKGISITVFLLLYKLFAPLIIIWANVFPLSVLILITPNQF